MTRTAAPDPQGLVTILDSLDALVYVSDMQTYELIFMNRYGEAVWGNWRGKRCFEVLQQGQTNPCAFCTNHLLLRPDGLPAEVHVWEFQNTVTGSWFQCRDQAIPWIDGRTVRLEIAVDITDRKRLEAELRTARDRAETLARIDMLTGLNSRRAFFDEAARIYNRAQRGAEVLCVAMIDIDNFKQINDRYGHFVGDEVIRRVAATIQENLRDMDLIGRLGGEEFGIVLPETEIDDARAVCERIRDAVQRLSIVFDDVVVGATCSIGVTDYEAGVADIDTLLATADRALYSAKRAGRNCVR